ncbi:hypothetical protein ACJJTC_017617 [Scirpophaga incertulas]
MGVVKGDRGFEILDDGQQRHHELLSYFNGQLCEELGGHTYYWMGKPSSERSASGVGFTIRNNIAGSLIEPPKDINDRLITLKLHMAPRKFLHLVSVSWRLGLGLRCPLLTTTWQQMPNGRIMQTFSIEWQQVVGKPQKKNQDWFDESDSEIRLVERSRLALGGAIDARHRSSIQRDLKVKIQGVKDSWWRHKAEELQWLADTS